MRLMYTDIWVKKTSSAPPGAQEEECGLCLLAKLSLLVNSPLTWLLFGLSIVGLTTAVRGEALRSWGLLLLTMALSGWVYQITDDMNGIVDIRSIHVGFGLLFGLSWVGLGCALWWSKTRGRLNKGKSGPEHFAGKLGHNVS